MSSPAPIIIASALRALGSVEDAPTVHLLTDAHRDEVLAFLAERSIHTVYMAGLIRDNGLSSPLNRGSFYACRDSEGYLEGVALIGHATIIEARTEAALEAFARVAQRCSDAYLIRGEQETVENFWSYYAEKGRESRLICREVLYELHGLTEVREKVSGLRLATLNDLESVMAVNAAMALEESGVDPSKRDPLGFRLRTARRIEQGRVWVWVENGELIFKADIVSDTPEAIYLEGIYVSPENRGRGYGLRCMSQLACHLLKNHAAICLVVNEQQKEAQSFYRKAGYRKRSYYDTIYLQQSH